MACVTWYALAHAPPLEGAPGRGPHESFPCAQMWDQVKGHEIKEVEQGAYALLAGTATATLLAAVVEF